MEGIAFKPASVLMNATAQKTTYIEERTAQKTKLYDMYSRLFRWASDHDQIEVDGLWHRDESRIFR
jgi:hypothetical protein